MRLLKLLRGESFIIAIGIEFENKKICVHWEREDKVEIYQSLQEFMEKNKLDSKYTVAWIDISLVATYPITLNNKNNL